MTTKIAFICYVIYLKNHFYSQSYVIYLLIFTYLEWKLFGVPVPQEVQESQCRTEKYHNPHHPSDAGH